MAQLMFNPYHPSHHHVQAGDKVTIELSFTGQIPEGAKQHRGIDPLWLIVRHAPNRAVLVPVDDEFHERGCAPVVPIEPGEEYLFAWDTVTAAPRDWPQGAIRVLVPHSDDCWAVAENHPFPWFPAFPEERYESRDAIGRKTPHAWRTWMRTRCVASDCDAAMVVRDPSDLALELVKHLVGPNPEPGLTQFEARASRQKP